MTVADVAWCYEPSGRVITICPLFMMEAFSEKRPGLMMIIEEVVVKNSLQTLLDLS